METLPQTLVCLAVAGLKYPTWTASLGAVWLAGRVMYTLGYLTGDPAKVRHLPEVSSERPSWADLILILFIF